MWYEEYHLSLFPLFFLEPFRTGEERKEEYLRWKMDLHSFDDIVNSTSISSVCWDMNSWYPNFTGIQCESICSTSSSELFGMSLNIST